MKKQTEYIIIGIGTASILAGVYGAFRTGEFMESVSGITIGAALIGTILFQQNRKNKTE